MFLPYHLARAFTTMAAVTTTMQAASGTLEPVTNFGDNPSGAKMFIYIPESVKANPAVVVGIHWCTGTAQAFYSSTPYAGLADEHGFIVIYPESPYDGGCWDVSSDATLTYEGGGNSNAIANMVRYTLETHNADADRVFAVGGSSGAMMTNVLAATYPDLFSAAIAYSGVPAGCFYTGTTAGWNSECANGESIRTPEEWAKTAKDMRPGYNGTRPKMQVYHGGRDDVLFPPNYNETIKQWSEIFGYSGDAESVSPNDPADGLYREVFGENLEGFWGPDEGHNIAYFGQSNLEWFGLL